jgi:hypothetical protein
LIIPYDSGILDYTPKLQLLFIIQTSDCSLLVAEMAMVLTGKKVQLVIFVAKVFDRRCK